MLRLLMIVSGAFEALFGLSVLIAPNMLIETLQARRTSRPFSWRAFSGLRPWDAIGALFVVALARARG